MQSSSGDNEFGSLLDSGPPFLNPSTQFNPPTSFEPSSSQSILAAPQGLNQVPFPSLSSMQPKPNPKKRTRASRKAPTTVLTTDPTNFKAMVQEFTGIPAPPFSSSASSSLRLDLFGSGSLGIRSSHSEPSLSSGRRVVQAATTPLLNNIPLVEASNMLNLQTQMVRPLYQGSSVSASLDELGFNHGGGSASLSGLHGNSRDGNQAHVRPFDGIYHLWK